MKSFNLSALLLAVFVSVAFGRITSFGDQTAEAARMRFEDDDFKIDPRKGNVVRTPEFKVFLASLTSFPVLAATDVQSQIARVHIRAGKPFLTHYHPRGTEILNVIKGRIKIAFIFEGLNPRTVTNVISAGMSTVFPQGLIHSSVCISKTDCLFVSVFNTADPGLVPVTH